MHQGRSSVMHCLHRRFRVFCIISAPTATPAWLWKSQAASLITTCYARASTKAINIRPDFGRYYRHLSFSNSQWKTGHFTLLYYIIPQVIWPRWASRQLLSLPIVQTLLPVTFGYCLSPEAVVMRQLRRWKRLWRRSLTRSHKRTSMGPSRSCWDGTRDFFEGK